MERNVAVTLVKAVCPPLVLEHITDRTRPGIPDYNVLWPDGAEAWVELKDLRSSHWVTKDQAAWLWKRRRAGGHVLLLGKDATHWHGWRPGAHPKWIAAIVADELAPDVTTRHLTADVLRSWVRG